MYTAPKHQPGFIPLSDQDHGDPNFSDVFSDVFGTSLPFSDVRPTQSSPAAEWARTEQQATKRDFTTAMGDWDAIVIRSALT